MAGEAILAYVPDLMFSVQLREAAAKRMCTVSLVSSHEDFSDRIAQVHPALVVLDLAAVGASLDALVEESKREGSRIIGFGPHVQKELLKRATEVGCDAVYPNSKFKMDTEEILGEWLD